MATTTVAQASSISSFDFLIANDFQLSLGRTTISFTPANFAGQPLLNFDDGVNPPRTFMGDDQVGLEGTALGTLVTVTLEAIPDLETHLLTLVLPEVLIKDNKPEKVAVPVIFHTVRTSIIGKPTSPGPVQTYDVKVFDCTANRFET